MEPLGQRRSKICVPDRRRTSSRGGNWQKQRHGNVENPSPENSSWSSYTPEEDLLDFVQRSSMPVSVPNGSPMKRLLANEMSREAEVKRQSPGVIARLMGLEGIPPRPQQTSGRSQRRQLEDLHRKKKVEKAERSENISSRGSSRRSSKDEQEFKDVFEVTEWSNLRSCDYVMPKTEEPDMNKAEMTFIRQRFLDAKRLSTDDKLQDSKEFDDALEVLNSNKDLLLKFLQQPDHLFAKHVRDIHGTTFEPHGSKNVAERKMVDAQDCETIPHSSNSLRENVLRKRGKSRENCQNRVPCQTPFALDSTSYKSTKRESPAAPYSFPTRIVVLKPHLGKGEDTSETNLSPSRQFSDFDIPPKFSSVKSSDTKLVARNGNLDQSKKSRGIPGEISRKARSTSSSIRSVSVPSSRHKFSTGDEGSLNMSLDESAYESDGGAKIRLSDRLKLAHKPCNKGDFSKVGTLAEMLAIPERLMRYTDLRKVGPRGLKGVSATSAQPLGISSRDGWKDVGLGKLSRSKSLPSSSTLIRSAVPRYSRTSRGHHNSCDFVETIPMEVAGCEKHWSTKGNFSTLDMLATGKLKYFSSGHLVPENSPAAAHRSVHEPASSTSSKEVDQPSPVSVLEAPFPDDFSDSSQCFESLSADLHGLRIQLELLKIESRAYAEESEFISGDDSAGEGVFHLLEGREFRKPAENWEFSYVTDMLMASGYVECEFDHYITTRHSLECPAGPSVFEQLETTYGNHNSSISERKLLFDLINLSIQEIYQPLMDPHPWLGPAAVMVYANWRKDPLPETVMMLVMNHEKKAGKEVLDKAFISDSKWLNSSNDIDLIGKDLGILLESELIDELLAV